MRKRRCNLPDENAIPIAIWPLEHWPREDRYSHWASHRYGRRMQLISGVHYNFSLREDAWPIAGLEAR